MRNNQSHCSGLIIQIALGVDRSSICDIRSSFPHQWELFCLVKCRSQAFPFLKVIIRFSSAPASLISTLLLPPLFVTAHAQIIQDTLTIVVTVNRQNRTFLLKSSISATFRSFFNNYVSTKLKSNICGKHKRKIGMSTLISAMI